MSIRLTLTEFQTETLPSGLFQWHGLRRTNDDKRRAVMTLLNDTEWSKWSDREIARQCAVDHKTVSRLREDHLGNSPDTTRTVERNGSTYTMNTSAIGKTAPKEDDDMEIAEGCQRHRFTKNTST